MYVLEFLYYNLLYFKQKRIIMKNNLQVLFLSHGGGPMPLLGDLRHKQMVECLQDIAQNIAKPSAILVVSAHWEQKIIGITASKNPSLIYDYYGFPEQSYYITYPALGEINLAKQIHKILSKNQIPSILDEKRGYDHGVFVPLKIMYEKADIPVIQLSLLSSLDPQEHLKIGQVLSQLEYENLLVVGSGFSFHNMRAFYSSNDKYNQMFENWLIQTCSNKQITEEQRLQRFISWTKAPAARYAHPREEHLLPLFVCYGMAQKACDKYYELEILNKKSSMYLWL